MILAFGGSPGELWIVLIIVVVLFGASAIPKLAKSIGQAKKEFEKGIKDGETVDEKTDADAGADADVEKKSE
ncbi:MAG: sec-independent protein translocase protein TatA [Verrucomicrobiales bacterium]|jgi:sec-independent protein translocase protein TatA